MVCVEWKILGGLFEKGLRLAQGERLGGRERSASVKPADPNDVMYAATASEVCIKSLLTEVGSLSAPISVQAWSFAIGVIELGNSGRYVFVPS